MRPERTFTPIDFAAWPRRETFYYFSKMAPTGYSLTVDLDATRPPSNPEGGKLPPLPGLPLAGHAEPPAAGGIPSCGAGRRPGAL